MVMMMMLVRGKVTVRYSKLWNSKRRMTSSSSSSLEASCLLFDSFPPCALSFETSPWIVHALAAGWE